MTAVLRPDERAERHDFYTGLACVGDQPFDQSLADALPTQALRYAGVIRDDRRLVELREGELGGFVVPVDARLVATAAGLVVSRDLHCPKGSSNRGSGTSDFFTDQGPADRAQPAMSRPDAERGGLA